MKPFRHALLLVMTLGFLGLHRQVSAQENTEETVPTELVERVAETKTSETDLTAAEEHQIDEIRTFVPASPNPLPEPPPVSDTLETNEVDEEDEEDLPEFDLSNIDQVIDQLYPSATALEEDIVTKSEEDATFKAYVDASLKTEALVSRYVEWQAQFSTDTEAPDIEAFLSGDVAQTDDFKAFVYKGIISDWLIGQYLNSLVEKAEHEATLEKKAVEAILSSQPRSEEELETYF